MWLRPDVVTCGVAAITAEFPRQVPDAVWIPVAAVRGWVIITGNRKIRTNPVESSKAIESKARIVCIAGRAGNRTSWDKMALLMRHWTSIDNMIEREQSGPWWLAVRPSGVVQQDYPKSAGPVDGPH